MKTFILHSLFVIASGFVLPRQSCSDPVARTEWRDLSDQEKSTYIEAVQCLKDVPSRLTETTSETLWDDFAYVHRELDSEIHFVANFLPWHRWFVYIYESALQADCNYTGVMPYWDWTRDEEDPDSSPIFDNDLGFGGDGDADTGCVNSGPFAGFNVSTPDNHCLQRVFDMTMLTQYSSQSEVDSALEITSYSSFRPTVENGPHRGGHAAISGDMANNYSPNDPIFFLHHTNIDRVWWQWQSESSDRQTEYSGNRYQNDASVEATLEDTLPMNSDLASEEYTVSDFMWVESGPLCYTY
ncbi:unnamed protein product [Clonostachys rosea]|uniref:Tyrosinase copper-binding domain-containing protein n=1 Tax=Bionectria ochroleuca TaxID=29856 RepID=A0ABY6UQ04_BIOOC|nr:unnamed protein product [Clonostachys rosea]